MVKTGQNFVKTWLKPFGSSGSSIRTWNQLSKSKVGSDNPEVKKSKMETPDDFRFPFLQPYDIQKDFMTVLYNSLDAGKLGIFESPTGTVCSISKYLYPCTVFRQT